MRAIKPKLIPQNDHFLLLLPGDEEYEEGEREVFEERVTERDKEKGWEGGKNRLLMFSDGRIEYYKDKEVFHSSSFAKL